MKVKVSIVCKCGSKQSVQIVKPGMFRPTISSFVCVDCESKTAYFVTRVPKKPGEITVSTKLVEISDTLKAMIEEAANEQTQA